MSQNWAICIGIDRYDNLQSLQYAKRDAEALREFFEKEAGFDKVYFFAEDAPPIPTDFGEPMHSTPSGGTLRRFLRVRFEQKFLKPSDNFWFFSPVMAGARRIATTLCRSMRIPEMSKKRRSRSAMSPNACGAAAPTT